MYSCRWKCSALFFSTMLCSLNQACIDLSVTSRSQVNFWPWTSEHANTICNQASLMILSVVSLPVPWRGAIGIWSRSTPITIRLIRRLYGAGHSPQKKCPVPATCTISHKIQMCAKIFCSAFWKYCLLEYISGVSLQFLMVPLTRNQ